jgi:hypothetical protein
MTALPELARGASGVTLVLPKPLELVPLVAAVLRACGGRKTRPRPRPPWVRSSGCGAWVKGSNARSRSSGAMPPPLDSRSRPS